MLLIFLKRLWPSLNYGLKQCLQENYTKEVNESWKKVYFYVCFHMKRGMENPDLDFDSFCNGTKWWNGQTHTWKQNTIISIIHNVQLLLHDHGLLFWVFLPFMYINIHVQEHCHLIVAIHGRHDRDANSRRSSLTVSDRSRGNSKL